MKAKLVNESLSEDQINDVANYFEDTINDEISPDLYAVYDGVYTEDEIEEGLTEVFFDLHSKNDISDDILDLTSLCIIFDERGEPKQFYWSYDATPQPVGDLHSKDEIDDMYQALNPYPVDIDELYLLPESVDALVERESDEY